MYFLMAMIVTSIYHMDPLCIVFVAMDISYIYIIHGSTVYLIGAMLTSYSSMGMPDLRREYLTCFCCRYCSGTGLQLLLPNGPSTIS
jgi:hypothetical protein